MTSVPRFLAPQDVARVLGVSTARVQQLDREGKLKAIRDSAGRRLFLPDDVKRLHDERNRTTAKNSQRLADRYAQRRARQIAAGS